MLSLSQNFHRARQDRNLKPLVLFSLQNAYGVRLYSDHAPSDELLGLAKPPLADGSLLADGARQAGYGADQLLDWGARVLSFGRLRETLTPLTGDLLASLGAEEPGTVSVVLAVDREGGLARSLAGENLLGAQASLRLGYPGLLAREFAPRFSGVVASYRLEPNQLTLSLRAA